MTDATPQRAYRVSRRQSPNGTDPDTGNPGTAPVSVVEGATTTRVGAERDP
jgi:hypothetical protein